MEPVTRNDPWSTKINFGSERVWQDFRSISLGNPSTSVAEVKVFSKEYKWRDVENILPVENVKTTSCQLTAKQIMESGLDLGFFPTEITDVDKENKWMTSINFTSSAPFNVRVVEKLNGVFRVEVVDFISEGEEIIVKYELEQKPIKINWKCLDRRIKRLNLQLCNVPNCCCYTNQTKVTNYFSTTHEDKRVLESSTLTSQKNTWNNTQLKINFQDAEDFKNQIFCRIPVDTFTRHTLWHGIAMPAMNIKRSPSYEDLTPNIDQCSTETYSSSDSPQRNLEELNTLPSTNFQCDDETQTFVATMPTGKGDDIYTSSLWSNNVNIECRLCGQILKNKRGLKIHLTRSHGDKNFGTNHQKKAANTKPTHQCDVCKKRLKTVSALKMHKTHRHPIKTEKRVEVNGRYLSSDVIDRRFNHNENVQKICCSSCDQLFSLEQLANHEEQCRKLQERRPGILQSPADCDDTQFVLNCENGISSPEENQLSTRNSQISDEDEEANSDIEKNSGAAYHCPICEYSFKHKLSLKYHIDSHVKPPPEFVTCPFCPATYNTEPELMRHMKVHKSEIKQIQK